MFRYRCSCTVLCLSKAFFVGVGTRAPRALYLRARLVRAPRAGGVKRYGGAGGGRGAALGALCHCQCACPSSVLSEERPDTHRLSTDYVVYTVFLLQTDSYRLSLGLKNWGVDKAQRPQRDRQRRPGTAVPICLSGRCPRAALNFTVKAG